MARSIAFALLATLALSGIAVAQTPTGDLELEVVQGPPFLTPASDIGTLIFRITNHGPDAVGFRPAAPHNGVRLIADRVPFHDMYGIAIFFPPVDISEIVYWDWSIPSPAPGQEPIASFIYTHLVLQPGQSWTQSIEYRVNYLANELAPSGHVDVPWRTSLATGNSDPNPGNNAVTLRFNLVPPARVPTLSPAGLMGLTLGLLLAFAWVRRRSRS